MKNVSYPVGNVHQAKAKMSLKFFLVNFDILLSQTNDELSICSIVAGDFNAQCSRWWRNDITNFAGKEIEFLTPSAGYT